MRQCASELAAACCNKYELENAERRTESVVKKQIEVVVVSEAKS